MILLNFYAFNSDKNIFFELFYLHSSLLIIEFVFLTHKKTDNYDLFQN